MEMDCQPETKKLVGRDVLSILCSGNFILRVFRVRQRRVIYLLVVDALFLRCFKGAIQSMFFNNCEQTEEFISRLNVYNALT